MSANIELSGDDIDIFIHNLNHPTPEVVEARKRFLTEEHKIDCDAIFRNCERFKVKVAKGEGLHGVTMNGKEFDITEVMESTFNAPDDR